MVLLTILKKSIDSLTRFGTVQMDLEGVWAIANRFGVELPVSKDPIFDTGMFGSSRSCTRTCDLFCRRKGFGEQPGYEIDPVVLNSLAQRHYQYDSSIMPNYIL